MQTADLDPVASEHHSALAETNSDGPHNWSAHQTESNSRSEKGIQFKVGECSDRTFNEDISERSEHKLQYVPRTMSSEVPELHTYKPVHAALYNLQTSSIACQELILWSCPCQI